MQSIVKKQLFYYSEYRNRSITLPNENKPEKLKQEEKYIEQNKGSFQKPFVYDEARIKI